MLHWERAREWLSKAWGLPVSGAAGDVQTVPAAASASGAASAGAAAPPSEQTGAVGGAGPGGVAGPAGGSRPEQAGGAAELEARRLEEERRLRALVFVSLSARSQQLQEQKRSGDDEMDVG